jgi:hypothetical protein
MQIPEDPTHPTKRRARLLKGAWVVVGIAAVLGIYYAFSSPRSELNVTELVLKPVQGHLKNQACGASWSEHRLIEIAPYFRGAKNAA